MSEKMKDSDETREEKFEERMLKYTKLKKKKRLMASDAGDPNLEGEWINW